MVKGLAFCCAGCEMIYHLLKENDLSAYYRYEKTPGISQKDKRHTDYEYLNDPKIVAQLLDFQEGNTSKITFHLPQIHCSSCLWLLENITRLEKGILTSRVNFIQKKATILFDDSVVDLKSLVHLLTKIGYPPELNLGTLDRKKTNTYSKRQLYQIGLAGFAFGNIMLLSFPEYLGFHQASFRFYIGYINIVLAIPVLFYSGFDYLKSAWKGLKFGQLNIDVPVAIGMITLFSQSLYEIISHTGEGYLDSFAGFVFFLLIGKWFQSFTYQALDFDRNYKSYFPISALIKTSTGWVSTSLEKIKEGDRLLIRNHELVPADGQIVSGTGRLDYSFVTGEADLIHKSVDQEVLAGGKQMGSNIEIKVNKAVDQSYLTQLWNDEIFEKPETSSADRMINNISRYFTIIILLIAFLTFGYWFQAGSDRAFSIFTAVLIVACPCALALAIPFAYGNILRIFSRRGFYLRNTKTIENLQDIDHIIFDKTGTLTDNTRMQVRYEGTTLTYTQQQLIKSSCMHSSHPLSQAIVQHFKDIPAIDVNRFKESIGKGIEARLGDQRLKLGSAPFIFKRPPSGNKKGVFIGINGKYYGHFHFEYAYRAGLEDIIRKLGKQFPLSVLSGDDDQERQRIEALFGSDAEIHFHQQPKNKLAYIRSLQAKGHKVMMIGDGLNDAGALKQSQVGIVISDAANNFSPACDGLLSAEQFGRLAIYIRYINRARRMIYGAFILALLYNIIGLSFAVTGQLSPVVAAILMPLSSISVIVYGIVGTWLLDYYYYRGK